MENNILLFNRYCETEETQWCLEAVEDAGRNWTAIIDSIPFVIGRANDCNVKLMDKRISRYHCEIRLSSGLLWIRDLGSTNGTLINKKKIDQAEMLEPDDIITIGKYQFKTKKMHLSPSATAEETLCSTFCEKDSDATVLETRLRTLIQKRDLTPHFQPIIRFADMKRVGYEVLGRVEDESLPSNPSDLLDVAERFGLSSELSSVFREVGVEIGKELPGLPVLFVNSERFEIYKMNSLLGSLQRIREIAPSSRIVLEINEKAALDPKGLSELRDRLKIMNISLAFDDFGVGQTRLIDLSTVSPEYLKFDISLIRQIHLAPKRLHQMISTFINASHDLGILALAEGIECPEELNVCQQLGFDFGQGYFLGKPESIDAINNHSGQNDKKTNEIQAFQPKIESNWAQQKKASNIIKVNFGKTIVLPDEVEGKDETT